MALSMAVLLVPIFLLLAWLKFYTGAKPPTVDPSGAFAAAGAKFGSLQPVGLPDGWHPITVDVSGEGGTTIRVGYVGPGDEALQLVESNVAADKLLPAELGEGLRPQGAVELGGRSWHKFTVRGDEPALVLLEPTRTVLVHGRAPEDAIRAFTATLTTR